MSARILLVDDDANLSRLFTKVLARQGYDVDPVMTAENAHALLNARRYDLVLCDMNLGSERGLDLINRNRARLDLCGTQVVVISGQDYLRELCMASGIEFFLSKPVGTHELAHFVNRILAGKTSAAPRKGFQASAAWAV
jgi:two-component system response regulator GlrR